MSTLATLATVRRSWDADAGAYIKAVESADQQQLEPMVAQAINQFVLGCKADGIWSAIKASCILMGARTLTGALTPLAGTAPTNNNFVSGDYNRKTGLVGNASTKYLNSGRANNADGQNDQHIALYLGGLPGNTQVLVGAGGTGSGASNVVNAAATLQVRSRNSTLSNAGGAFSAIGFYGKSRAASGSFAARGFNTNGVAVSTTVTITSQTPSTDSIFVFGRNNGSGALDTPTSARIAFYSIGSSLTLATLDTRVSTLYTAIGAAIA